MTGIERVAAAFARRREAGQPAIMPYWPLGYPDRETSVRVVVAAAQAGADLMELGVPFSDPLADGPVIQRATQQALAAGTTVRSCLDMVAAIRGQAVEIPLLLMGYLNPLLSFGLPAFVGAAAEAGADGLIVPDLPPEEATELLETCRVHGLATVFLLAPNSPLERIDLALRHSTGFVYLVTVTGVTGARRALPPELPAFISLVRQRQAVRGHSALPLAAGFGISSREQVGELHPLVDGVIVGSALVSWAGSAPDPVAAASDFVASLSGQG